MYLRRNLISILLLAQVLQSCDPEYRAEIFNKSNRLISVQFNFDKEIAGRALERHISFSPDVIDNNQNTNISFTIDSVKFIVNAQVQAFDSLNVEMGIGTHPKFEGISVIKVFASDTIILDSKEKMLNAFRRSKRLRYALVIK